MKQFLQLSEDLDAESYIITSHSKGYSETRVERFIFDNHPKPSHLKVRCIRLLAVGLHVLFQK